MAGAERAVRASLSRARYCSDGSHTSQRLAGAAEVILLRRAQLEHDAARPQVIAEFRAERSTLAGEEREPG